MTARQSLELARPTLCCPSARESERQQCSGSRHRGRDSPTATRPRAVADERPLLSWLLRQRNRHKVRRYCATRSGTVEPPLASVPRPSKRPPPQHQTVSSTATPQVWKRPALIETNFKPPATATGCGLSLVPPLPSWPSAFVWHASVHQRRFQCRDVVARSIGRLFAKGELKAQHDSDLLALLRAEHGLPDPEQRITTTLDTAHTSSPPPALTVATASLPSWH